MNEYEQDQMLEIIKEALKDDDASKPASSFIATHVMPLLFSMFKPIEESPTPSPTPNISINSNLTP